ncbi:DNA polymerase I [Thermomonospora umbrina]|uniref:DNA polymerase I n=1 Tax=Thermomonospora umbrina TaxID=111806 RepID=A0A3D9SZL8_9ACTN|nr:DNA polymerase I [Thermomonospora umbrina]REF01028.1 DNA polymerase I [Thermomonospora umbrina]
MSGRSGSERSRLLLVDGHSLAYRAFYALPVENFSTTGGQPTNLVYGFASMLANALRDERPTHVAVAFDVSRRTFRTEAFPAYKAGRAKSPEEFGGQLVILDDLLAAMSVPTLRVPGYEADDVIATLTARARAEDGEVLIITGDRDVFQLVDDHVTVLYFTRTVSEPARYTPERVQERYGLTPRQYPDFAALRGDPSDNLPSIPGIGEKTAAKWIREYGTLAALLDRAEEVPGKAGERLRAALDVVRLNRRLTELVRDVDLPDGMGDLEGLRRAPYDLPAFTTLLDDLEFRNPSLRERLFAADPGGGREPAAEGPVVRIRGSELEPGTLGGWLAGPAGDRPVGLVTVHAWARGAGRITHVGLATGDGFATAFEVARLTEADERVFAHWLADPEAAKVVDDAKALLRVSAEHAWEVRGVAGDTAMAAYLLRPGLAAYSLDDLAGRYLGRRPPSPDGPGWASALMVRARMVLDLEATLGPRLADTGMGPLLATVELPLAGLLARMERAGVNVDRAMLGALENRFADGMREVADEAARVAGRPFNPGSTKQLQQVLFEDLGLPRTKKIKSGHSTDADALAWLAERTDNPLPRILLRHRDLARLHMTVAGLLRELGADGRVHSTFQQTVAATGRLTSTEPNLQVIPIRTTEGRLIRRAFVPGEGYASLMTADYSQLELRVMAHLSRDPMLLEAFASGEDLHTTMAAQVFGVAPAAVDAQMRRRIKAMSYGLAYGLSAFGLAKQLGVPVEEARPLMDAYFERFGGVRDFLARIVDEARERGHTETLLGRRRHLPALTSDHHQRRQTAERMALNAPVQGSAADLVKLAMLRVDEALREAGLRSRLLLQVHDELVLEIAPGEEAAARELVRDRMTTAHPLVVPLEVAVGSGGDWDAAAH